MGVHFDTRQVQELALDFSKAPLGLQRRASQIVRKVAFDIERDSKIMVPVDTGNLKNSISSDIRTLSAEIGPTAEYGHYVEFGTSRMSPQPYMRPALDRNAQPFARALANAAEDAVS